MPTEFICRSFYDSHEAGGDPCHWGFIFTLCHRKLSASTAASFFCRWSESFILDFFPAFLTPTKIYAFCYFSCRPVLDKATETVLYLHRLSRLPRAFAISACSLRQRPSGSHIYIDFPATEKGSVVLSFQGTLCHLLRIVVATRTDKTLESHKRSRKQSQHAKHTQGGGKVFEALDEFQASLRMLSPGFCRGQDVRFLSPRLSGWTPNASVHGEISVDTMTAVSMCESFS